MIERIPYNLLYEKWIPVLWKDGKIGRLGIIEALTQADRVRQISASNPMDRFAVMRFLLALLYWCKGNPPDRLPEDSFSLDWFNKLHDHKDCFNLLGEGKRFYQCKPCDHKNEKLSSNYLVQEVPTGTNLWHFRHSTDINNGLCSACCAMGLLRLPVFATSGGRGKPPGINAKPPIYVIPLGSSLADTLLHSWREVSDSDLGAPTWEKPDLQLPKKGKVPLLTGLTWLPRRVWLDDPEEPEDNCISCGRQEHMIRQCVFAGTGSTQQITRAKLETFPSGIAIPEKLNKRIMYDKSEKCMFLKGNLIEKDRNDLLKLSSDNKYQKAVNELYSSQPHREWNDPHIIRSNGAVVTPSNALNASDASAKQWAKIMEGILEGQKTADWLWIVGFSTVDNDKYLEATEYVSPRPLHSQPKKITIWKEDKLEDRLRKILRGTRKHRKGDACIATSAVASIRPHVEGRVSARASELIAGNDAAWEQAAREYSPMMKAIAKSLSPGFTTAAVKRRIEIACVMPDMQPKSKTTKKSSRKKGGDK